MTNHIQFPMAIMAFNDKQKYLTTFDDGKAHKRTENPFETTFLFTN